MERTIREIGGELHHEVSLTRRQGVPHFDQLDWQAENAMLDLVMAVLARYAGATIVNDEDFPVQPLPRDMETDWEIPQQLHVEDWETDPIEQAAGGAEAVRRLVNRWTEFISMEVPPHTDASGLPKDTIAWLLPEDTYVRGLASRFLRLYDPATKPRQEVHNERQLAALLESEQPPVGIVGIGTIELDRTTDAELATARPRTEQGKTALTAWREYRRAVVNLATALSEASGVPIVDWDRSGPQP